MVLEWLLGCRSRLFGALPSGQFQKIDSPRQIQLFWRIFCPFSHYVHYLCVRHGDYQNEPCAPAFAASTWQAPTWRHHFVWTQLRPFVGHIVPLVFYSQCHFVDSQESETEQDVSPNKSRCIWSIFHGGAHIRYSRGAWCDCIPLRTIDWAEFPQSVCQSWHSGHCSTLCSDAPAAQYLPITHLYYSGASLWIPAQ